MSHTIFPFFQWNPPISSPFQTVTPVDCPFHTVRSLAISHRFQRRESQYKSMSVYYLIHNGARDRRRGRRALRRTAAKAGRNGTQECRGKEQTNGPRAAKQRRSGDEGETRGNQIGGNLNTKAARASATTLQPSPSTQGFAPGEESRRDRQRRRG